MILKELYSDLVLKIGFSDSECFDNWDNLVKSYSSKSRHYHNLLHIEAMIKSYLEYKSNLNNPDEVLYAIFYHDYIYKATRKDNELKSAELALSILPTSTTLNKTLIYDMICATQLHNHHQKSDVNWLIDFDLKILGSNWEDYKSYCNQIRKEYKIYPDFLYKPGRKKALEHFLENEFIFQTEIFREQFEEKARINILREIKEL